MPRVIMSKTLSKSQFKPRALEVFRDVERTGTEVVITDHGRPVILIAPYAADPEAALATLRGTVVRYDKPTEPVAAEDWEALR